jgi:hypothetical protein
MDERSEGQVLLDVAADAGEFECSLLERFGHPVEICNGPEPDALCPLVAGEGCTRFEHARGVIVELDLDRDHHRTIIDRYRALGRPGLPIAVVCTPDQALRHADQLEGVTVWTRPPTSADLDGFAALVEAADRFS